MKHFLDVEHDFDKLNVSSSFAFGKEGHARDLVQFIYSINQHDVLLYSYANSLS